MKRLISFGAACVLTLVLSTPASAGYIATGSPAPPPPSSPSSATTDGGATDTTVTTGQGQTSDAPTDSAAAADSLMEAALNLVGSLLSLL
jgi:hypothetical protein